MRNVRPGFVTNAVEYNLIKIADYELTNNGAEIRRLKSRIAALALAKATQETKSESAGGVTVEDCPADNRVRLFFPAKPSEDVRERLKSCGFRWTPSLGCWQAYRNPNKPAGGKWIGGG